MKLASIFTDNMIFRRNADIRIFGTCRKGEKISAQIGESRAEIVAKDDTLVAGGEGCLSVPEIYDDVERSQRITLRYYDSSFTPQEEVIEGFTAVIFQHEIDHLDGKLFIDYLK